MAFSIPEDLARALGPDDRTALIEIVLLLYQMERISEGYAVEVRGIDYVAFRQILADRDLYLNYSMEDVEHDIQAGHEIARQSTTSGTRRVARRLPENWLISPLRASGRARSGRCRAGRRRRCGPGRSRR